MVPKIEGTGNASKQKTKNREKHRCPRREVGNEKNEGHALPIKGFKTGPAMTLGASGKYPNLRPVHEI